jgi:hypothetical protein
VTAWYRKQQNTYLQPIVVVLELGQKPPTFIKESNNPSRVLSLELITSQHNTTSRPHHDMRITEY